MKRFSFVVKLVLFFFVFQTTAFAWDVQPNGAGFKASWGAHDELRVSKRQIQIIEAESYDRSKEYSTSMAYRPERPLASKEQFLADFTAGKLLATPEQFREAFERAGVSVTDVLKYLQGLEWRKNSVQKPARMARILHSYGSKRSRLDYGLVRNLEAGEYALWNGDRPIVAGDCGNVIVAVIGEQREQRKIISKEPSPVPPSPPAVVERSGAESAQKETWLGKNWPLVVVGIAAIAGIAIATGGHGGGGSSPSLGPSPPPPGNN